MAFDLDQSDDNLVLFDDVVVEYAPGFADADADAVENAQARENLRTRTAQNEDEIELVAARTTDLETRAETADGERQSQGSAINILQSKSSSQGDDINSLQTEQTALKGRVSDAENEQSSQGEAITGLQNEQSSQGDTLDSLQSDYTKLSGRVTDTETGQQANTSAIEETRSQAQKNADDISATSGRLTDYQASIDSIDLVLPPGDDTNAKTRTLINARATQSVQATVEQHGDTLTSHGEDITHLQNRADTADGERQATADSLDSTQTTVTQHGDTLTSHGERLNQLDTEYSDQQGQIDASASKSELDTVESGLLGSSSVNLLPEGSGQEYKISDNAIFEITGNPDLSAIGIEPGTFSVSALLKSNGADEVSSQVSLMTEAGPLSLTIGPVTSTTYQRVTGTIQTDSKLKYFKWEDISNNPDAAVKERMINSGPVARHYSTPVAKASEVAMLRSKYEDQQGQIDSKATIQQVKDVQSDAKGARASLKTNLESDYNGKLASVSQDISTKADADTVESLYTLRVQGKTADGKDMLAGFGLGVEGGTSNAIFNVNNFSVGAPGADATYAFVVDGDRVIMDEALIGKVTFSKLVDDAGTFLVQNGKIQAKFLQTDAIQIGYSQVDGGPPSDADKTSENTSKSTKSGSATGSGKKWSLGDDGAFEMQASSAANGGKLLLDNTGVRGYDADNNLTWAAWNSGTLVVQQADVIDTLQIKNQAVTFPQSASQFKKVTFDGTNNYKYVFDASFYSSGAPCQITFFANYYIYADDFTPSGSAKVVVRDYSNAGHETVLFDHKFSTNYADNSGTVCFPLEFTPKYGSGQLTFILSMWTGSSNSGTEYQAFKYLELKDNK